LELTDSTFDASLKGCPLAFVDVYASWCGSCRLFAPVFATVAARHPEAAFFKIDGDAHPGFRQDLEIQDLPYVAVYRYGRFVEGQALSKEEALEAFIRKASGSA
jgi:thioredoxin-like negative regulator of GroEL